MDGLYVFSIVFIISGFLFIGGAIFYDWSYRTPHKKWESAFLAAAQDLGFVDRPPSGELFLSVYQKFSVFPPGREMEGVRDIVCGNYHGVYWTIFLYRCFESEVMPMYGGATGLREHHFIVASAELPFEMPAFFCERRLLGGWMPAFMHTGLRDRRFQKVNFDEYSFFSRKYIVGIPRGFLDAAFEGAALKKNVLPGVISVISRHPREYVNFEVIGRRAVFYTNRGELVRPGRLSDFLDIRSGVIRALADAGGQQTTRMQDEGFLPGLFSKGDEPGRA